MASTGDGNHYTGPQFIAGFPQATALVDNSNWPYVTGQDVTFWANASPIITGLMVHMGKEYTILLINYLSLLAQIAAIYAQLQNQGGGEQPIDEEEQEFVNELPDFSADIPGIGIQPFKKLDPLVKKTKKAEAEEARQPEALLLDSFAKQTDKNRSFAKNIHQSGTFVPTTLITPFFEEETDGETSQYGEQEREGR